MWILRRIDGSVGRSAGGSKDPLNDVVIPHSRPRPLATPLDRAHTQHTTQARRRTDGRTEGRTMAGPDRRGRRRRRGRGIGEGGSRREGGTEPLNSQLLRSAKVCLSVCQAAAGWGRRRRKRDHDGGRSIGRRSRSEKGSLSVRPRPGEEGRGEEEGGMNGKETRFFSKRSLRSNPNQPSRFNSWTKLEKRKINGGMHIS